MQVDQLKPGQPGFLFRGWIVVVKMGFADDRRPVTRRLEPGRQQYLARGKRRVVHAVAMAVRITPREKRSPRRDADRRLNEGIREVGRFRGQPIQTGSLDDPVAVGAHAVVAKLVGHDPQDVGPPREFGRIGCSFRFRIVRQSQFDTPHGANGCQAHENTVEHS